MTFKLPKLTSGHTAQCWDKRGISLLLSCPLVCIKVCVEVPQNSILFYFTFRFDFFPLNLYYHCKYLIYFPYSINPLIYLDCLCCLFVVGSSNKPLASVPRASILRIFENLGCKPPREIVWLSIQVRGKTLWTRQYNGNYSFG